MREMVVTVWAVFTVSCTGLWIGLLRRGEAEQVENILLSLEGQSR